MKLRLLSLAVGICFVSIACQFCAAQGLESKNPFLAYARDRVVRPVDDARRMVLSGNLHPLAQANFRLRPVPPEFPMNRMMLVLTPDPAQQAALNELLTEQQDVTSPNYHKWVTPEKFGELFGASEGDIAIVVKWLESHGMTVEEVSPGRRTIVFSGNAGQVLSAFNTRIQNYRVAGDIHHANDSDPEIPQAFAGVVAGVVSLHDFRSEPMHVTPAFN